MKLLRLLILLGVFIGSQPGRAQVFAYPGATWVFHHPMYGMCFEDYEKWTYLEDTIINGAMSKKVKVDIVLLPPSPFAPQFYNYDKFFRVSGDTVSVFSTDSTWFELYNFSVQIGDTVASPLRNSFGFGFNCDDSVLYYFPATVIDTGHSVIGGQSLRFYKVKYRVGTGPGDDFSDTTFAQVTYYERMITYNGYWYPDDIYWCGGISECIVPPVLCYSDSGMFTNTLCYDLTWFDHLSISEEGSAGFIKVFPNPASNQLFVDEPNVMDGKYRIISLEGKQLGGWMQSPLNVAHLQAGIYFVLNESHTWTKKFIKH